MDSCDGHDAADIFRALQKAQDADRPVMIACRTIIGFGMPGREGTQKAHSDAPGAEVVAGTRKELDWPYERLSWCRTIILNQWRAIGATGAEDYDAWAARKAASKQAKEFDDTVNDVIPLLAGARPGHAQATAFGGKAQGRHPQDVGEGAGCHQWRTAEHRRRLRRPDAVEQHQDQGPESRSAPASYNGRYIHYGIREHGMAAAMNGMALHGGIIPYGGTFLVFSDYCRPSIRLAALMGIRVVFVMTHDSIGVGEDGPTHQPVEHLAALRAIPGLKVFRPADGVETAECWELALERCPPPQPDRLLAPGRADPARQSHERKSLGQGRL